MLHENAIALNCGRNALAYLLRDEEMIATVKKYVDAILSAQQPDGWICTCPGNKRAKYDTWAVQLISKTLTVYYECSGDARVPEATPLGECPQSGQGGEPLPARRRHFLYL